MVRGSPRLTQNASSQFSLKTHSKSVRAGKLQEEQVDLEAVNNAHLLKNIRFFNDNVVWEFDDCSDFDDPDNPDLVQSSEGNGEDTGTSEFSCLSCDFTSQKRTELNAHLVIHGNKALLNCEICEDVFSAPQALRAHLSTKHPSVNLGGTRKYDCKFCERKFSTITLRSNHIQHAHAHNAKYHCIHCSKRFLRKSALDQHLRVHSDTLPFKCDKCDAAFRSKGTKNAHMKRHLKFREYKCKLCDRKFVRKDQLKVHIVCVHNKKCLYKCLVCNRSLKGHVLSHLRTHTNEKQHKCGECGKCFAQSSQLTVHMRTHTGDKPYKCTYCKASFYYSTACTIHVRIHTGEKPVKCLLCPAAFSQLAHLKKHMRCIHKTEKPYVCVPCNMFYNTKAELQTHIVAEICKGRVSPKKKALKSKV